MPSRNERVPRSRPGGRAPRDPRDPAGERTEETAVGPKTIWEILGETSGILVAFGKFKPNLGGKWMKMVGFCQSSSEKIVVSTKKHRGI